MSKEKLCLRCMRKIGDSNVCPYCRNESEDNRTAAHLPLKTVIGGRYLIGKLVEYNSEGSTYYGFDLERKIPVTVREFFPEGLLSRGEGNYCLVNVGKAAEFIDRKEEFLNLWKNLASISGFTALTPVTDIVEDMGTVYTVSEYLGEGKTLREYLLEKDQGYISWDEARVLFMPVLSALDELHSQGVIHGGISPTTLVIDKNGKVRITGYCTRSVRREKSGITCELFDGYAAVEQYGFSEDLTPATDIYAFAAVLYRALIGSTPMSASSRLTNDKLMIPGKFAEQLPAYVINALVNALQILPGDRTDTVEALRGELSASPAAAGTASNAYSEIYDSREQDAEEDAAYPAEEEQDVPQDYKKLKKSTIAAFVISVVLCLGILISVLVGINGMSDKGDETTTDADTSTTETTEEETELQNIVSIAVPDFRGKKYSDIKTDETYAHALIINTVYVDSEEDIGVVVAQDLPEGTMVSSVTPRTITLQVSKGLLVPDVEKKPMKDAVDELEEIGFKNVESQIGGIAPSADESNMVYSLVYENRETGEWEQVPADRHLSAGAKLILYYYGEYAEDTTETSAEESQQDAPVVNEQEN